jgi:hypothetical protein
MSDHIEYKKDFRQMTDDVRKEMRQIGVSKVNWNRKHEGNIFPNTVSILSHENNEK